MSNFNDRTARETFISKDKVIIFTESAIILAILLTFGLSTVTKNLIEDTGYPESSTEKKTKKEDVSSGEEVLSHDIDLDDYSSNITIKNSGEYTIKGEFTHSLLIDADGDVTLNLAGANISSPLTAAIANISEYDLTINLVSNTKNILKDGGSSEYDGCIYSNGNLIIEGDGALEVYGNQNEGEGIATETKDITIKGGNIYIESEDDGINAGGDGGLVTISDGNIFIKASGDGIDSNKNLVIDGGVIYTIGSPKGGDAGIDTDDGFAINGGTVIALGSGMLETPLTTSRQHTVSFTLPSTVQKDTLVTLTDTKGQVVVSFVAQESFQTLIISSDKLTNGTYNLYTGGTNSGKLESYIYSGGTFQKGDKVEIGNETDFTLTSTITNIR